MLKQDLSTQQSASLDTRVTDDIIGYRLRRAQLSVFHRFRSVFADMEIGPADYAMLVLIDDNPGRRQTDIADALGIKQANFVSLVRAFEERGLIERLPAETDKRVKAIHLTPRGAAFLAEARKLHDEMEAALVSELGGEEARDTLLKLLDRLDQ